MTELVREEDATRDLPEGEVEAQKNALKELVDRSERYLEIYGKVQARSAPKALDRFLQGIGLTALAMRRRLARLEEYLREVDDDRRDAERALSSVIELAEASRSEAARHNTQAVGAMVKLEQRLAVQERKVEAVIERCRDTIALVERAIGQPLPSDRMAWAMITFDPAQADPSLPVEERVRHQEQWRAVVEVTRELRDLHDQVRVSESVRRLSSLFEQLAARFAANARGELALLGKRFEVLRMAITLGELARIDNFFREKVAGVSLEDLRSDIRQLEQRIESI